MAADGRLDLEPLELRSAHEAVSRYERDFFRERWFATDQGLLPFAWEAARTLDEGDKSIKALPRERYLLDHFQNLLREDIYIVLKSRQIMITWATFIFLVWECLRFPYRKIGIVPKKADDGKDHIEDRIQSIIWSYLPQWLRDDFPMPSLARGQFQLNWHPGPAPWVPATGTVPWTPDQRWFSWLASFEKGEHQIRQYTLTDIFWDEMAFQDRAQRAWAAALPSTIRRGKKDRATSGKVQCVSTMLPDSFHDTLCGDHVTVDNAVAIAFGQMKPPESGFYKNPLPGVVHYRNTKFNSFVAVYSFLADSEKRDPLWEVEASTKLGGKDSPAWLLDFRMQRNAYRGTMVYPHFDPAWNVVPERPVNQECEIFVSLDVGHTVPSSMLFWEWNAEENQLTGFDEIYLTTTSVSTMKKIAALKLATHLKMAVEDVVFADVLGHNVCDPNAVGTMLEYASEPNPLYLVGNPQSDAGERAWKINDRSTGEMRLDSALRPSFVHCGVRQYADDGKQEGICQSVVVDGAVRRMCEAKVPAKPMLVMMLGRMPSLERELPRQQRADPSETGLEAPERNKKGEPDHSSDSARYAVMRYPHFFGVEALDKPAPRILRLAESKLTTEERFWRERHVLAEASGAQAAAFAEVGSIEYPDEDGEEDDAYA